MSKKLKFPNLKQGMFTSPQYGEAQFPMYIIEDLQDLKNFEESISLHSSQRVNFREDLLEGKILIVNDPHPRTGFPTYCFESTETAEPHPSSFFRVKTI